MTALIKKMHLILKLSCITITVLCILAPQLAAQEWMPVEIETSTTLRSIYFIDRNIGWVVGDGGTIFHTTDGGKSWIRQDGRTSEQLNRVFFFDEYTGWIAGNNNLILTTQNGGKHWTERRPSPVPGQHILAIQFADWKRGWAAGGPGGQIYYTDNSGLTWQHQGNLSRDSTISSIQIHNHQTATAIYGNRIHHTSNAGTDWNENYLITELVTFNAEDLSLVNDTIGFAIGNHQSDGIILHTSDGGKNWSEIKRLPEKKLNTLAFLDDQKGYVVGSQGIIIRTIDSGKNWDQVNTVAETNLIDIFFADPGSGWLAGENGTLYQLLHSEVPDVEYYQNHYPTVQIENDSEAFELLERSEQYGRSALEREYPEKRTSFYGRMLAAIYQAEDFLDEEQHDEILEHISLLKQYLWGQEYNSGAELFNQSLEQEDSLSLAEKSKIHLQNAVHIQPDSIQSHLSLAHVYGSLNNYPAAISAMEIAINLMDMPDIDHQKYLIDLFIYEDRIKEAIERSLLAMELYPEELQLYEIAVDLYLEIGEIDEAISLLNILIDKEPDNSNYYHVRGVQLRDLALSKLEPALELYEEIWQRREKILYSEISNIEKQTLEHEIEERMEKVKKLEASGTNYASRAASDLKKFTELNPENEAVTGLLGVFYYTRAFILYEMLTLTHDTEEAKRFEDRINNYFIEAKFHLERAVELNPDIEYWWEVLYNIYLTLGMIDEADQILDKGYF